MNVLREGASVPREVWRANQEGFMAVPLRVLAGLRRWGGGGEVHFSEKPAVVCGERGVVETPPFKVVPVPVFDREVGGDFHPVTLGLEVAMHGGCGHSCAHVSAALAAHGDYIPE